MSAIGEALGAVSGLASGLTGAVSGGDAAGLANAVGALDSAPAVGGGVTDEQYIDFMAAVMAGTTLPGVGVEGIWKSNRKVYMNPANLAYFKELGLVSTADPAAMTKADNRFITLFALVMSASARKTVAVEGDWKTNRKNYRTPGNLDLFKEWGVIG